MYYKLSSKEVYEKLSSRREGLRPEEVISSRKTYGPNKLESAEKPSIFSVFLDQFKDLLVIILIIAAIISAITGSIESTIVILIVITMNAVLGTLQAIKADKSLESLKKLSSPTAHVVRNGIEDLIPAEDLVVGDIIKLEAGDIVPADGRILEIHSLKTNESMLTGESDSVEKIKDPIDEELALGDRKNMVFSGSMVTYGRAIAIITAVGPETELGKIAGMMKDIKEKRTPLQVSMDKFSKNLSILVTIICLIVFAIAIYRGESIIDALLFAVALAVAAIPEALASIITISLAIGTSRMAKENAIVKKLNAVEGLGCISIICSDKTGTLTQNKMTVVDYYVNQGDKNLLIKSAALCNNTVLVDGNTLGDPTETALVNFYMNRKSDYESLVKNSPRIAELPFDSERKLMSTLHKMENSNLMFCKGAVDVLLSRSESHIVDGQVLPLTEEDKKKIADKNFDFSNKGLRVLAFAYRDMENDTGLDLSEEEKFIFLGLIAMVDPPRAESARAVSDCRAAGIKPIMITGDHKVTASAIARQIGILQDGDLAITGPQLDAMSQEELSEKLAKISVYARVSPDNKIRIVKAWQDRGNIVAMTGDGVNDAPALKKADIGIAMGITGTEVSKDAASMVLTDDNFATIIKSVLNGRNIYRNIQNAIQFLLSGNAAGIITVIYAALAGLPAPFAAVHLLFINLLTDSLPALAVSMEAQDRDLIYDQPRKSDESMLTKNFIGVLSFQGILLAIATIAAFYIGLNDGKFVAMTMAFATLCLGRLWHGFNARGKKSIVKLGITSNLFTVAAFLLGTLLLAFVLYVPWLQTAFLTANLSLAQSVWIALLSFIPTFLIQLKRFIISDKKIGRM